MNTKILCVDDEPNVLEAFSRSLRKDFQVFVALSGDQAIAMIENEGPFAVVISDMRMPGMDGIQLLCLVKEIAPESVRVMLTGNADQQTAMNAVNEGNIFRFLTKPCPPEDLVNTLKAGVEQYRLVTAEKKLLEETLNKSIEVLVDILAIVNPTAFSRSTRVKKMAREIADSLGVDNVWEIEIAALLSQIGCVTVPEEILQKIADGASLSNKETGLYHQHPRVGHDLIARIPRMETVAAIVADQNHRIADESIKMAPSSEIDKATLGARILKVVLDFDRLIIGGSSPQMACQRMSERMGLYDPRVFAGLLNIVEGTAKSYQTLDVRVSDLKPGMSLGGVLVSERGSVLLPVGQEITTSLI
ncbi:MAG TPA: HD domain-containing phosphohydrolase, partial [Pyrinomonadaceae bacterium]|nr:HD domain-containing phosphohydrolase [Pyrinomonadaceae bacterium]